MSPTFRMDTWCRDRLPPPRARPDRREPARRDAWVSWGLCRALPRPAAVVSDEQILALVAAADGLRRWQRQRYAGGSPAAAADIRLDSCARTRTRRSGADVHIRGCAAMAGPAVTRPPAQAPLLRILEETWLTR